MELQDNTKHLKTTRIKLQPGLSIRALHHQVSQEEGVNDLCSGSFVNP